MSPRNVAYLGPAGTFTQQALLTQADLGELDHVPLPTIRAVLEATSSSDADLGFAAIENSIEGAVNATLDALAFELDLLIQREVVYPVEMCLLAHDGVSPDELRQVASFPHAAAQCHHFLGRSLPDATIVAANSTADAARELAESGSRTSAVIATALAASTYGLEILARHIEDHPENHTRFVVVAPEGIPAPTGHDKTSIVTFQRANRPGSLVNILQEFSARSINLTHLQSRPTKRELGDYCFVIELEGHVADERVADCLKNVQAKQAHVRFLGSYPADGERADSTRTEANEAWDEAERWIAELRAGIR
jgi:prephenate dehydratase